MQFYKENSRELIAKYVENFEFQVINLFIYNVYGEEDQRDKIIPSLFKIDRIYAIDLSPGIQLLSMTHVDDIIKAYVLAIDRITHDAYNYNAENYYLVNENLILLKGLVRIIEEIRGEYLKINWGGYSYSSYQIMTPRIIKQYLPGWRLEISLQEGLKRVLKSYMK